MKTLFNSFILLSVGIFLFHCGSNSNKTQQNNPDNVVVSEPDIIKLHLEPEKDEYIIGEDIQIVADLTDSLTVDSIKLTVDAKPLDVGKQMPYKFKWSTITEKVGDRNVAVTIYSGGKQKFKNINLRLLSDLKPKSYGFKVVKSYPHDIEAYTQGLYYENGFFYEATGLKGSSSLRRVKLETGEIFQSYTIPNEYFGEGITLYKDKIIQLTWEDHIGFVYNKTTFDVISQFSYSTQGWGITTIGDKLVMSDGSSTLYFLDANTLSVTSTLEVFDDKGPVKNLNELEYIENEIYANIYGSDIIVKINPENGKVTGSISLKGILSPQDIHDKIDVLNGIAFDPAKKRLFVTGKRWPKLFEIKLEEK